MGKGAQFVIACNGDKNVKDKGPIQRQDSMCGEPCVIVLGDFLAVKFKIF